MTDIWSKDKRSKVMSKIRGTNTKPEIVLRKELYKLGYRYRINDKKLSGKPDIVLRKYKTVIFVNGCFWHYHKECNEGKIPKTNSKFWEDKLQKNILRDILNKQELEALGWQVIVIWECEIEKKLNVVVQNLIQILK